MPDPESVTVVIPAREKVSVAAECLTAVLRHTPRPFRVVLVDVGYPPHILSRLEQIAGPAGNVTIVRGERQPTLANAAFNLALEHTTDPYVCVVENDVVVRPGYWQRMREVLRGTEAELVSPTIIDRRAGRIHFDPPRSAITTSAGAYHSDLVRRPKPEWPRVMGTRRVFHLEKHCFAGQLDAMRRLAPLDEDICTRTDLDLSFTCFEKGVAVFMAPEAEVEFVAPPIEADDVAFFTYRWDEDRARAANERLVAKWRLVDTRGYTHFIDEMRAFIPQQRQGDPA